MLGGRIDPEPGRPSSPGAVIQEVSEKRSTGISKHEETTKGTGGSEPLHWLYHSITTRCTKDSIFARAFLLLPAEHRLSERLFSREDFAS